MKMTNEEIKEVLDAFDLGKELQFKTDVNWIISTSKSKQELLFNLYADEEIEYRVKPEPKKVELYGRFNLGKLGYSILDFTEDIWVESDTHKLSCLLNENGEPICDSIKLEKL